MRFHQLTSSQKIFRLAMASFLITVLASWKVTHGYWSFHIYVGVWYEATIIDLCAVHL
jgi:hypothetical protein